MIYTKSILLSLLLSVIEWKTTVSASVPRDVLRANKPRDVLRANNVLCTLASKLCRLDKEVPEHRSSVNYAGVHPWETPTVVLITNNAWIFPRHYVTIKPKYIAIRLGPCAIKGQWKRNQLSSLPRRDQALHNAYIFSRLDCKIYTIYVCAEGREPRKTERYVS